MRKDTNSTLHFITRFPVRTGVLVALLCAAFATTGCKRKDASKCQEGQDGVRKSFATGDEALLNKWRNYAYKYCDDQAALSALDQEISQKRADAAKQKAEAEKKQRENEQLLGLFVQWVGSHRANPAGAAATASCDGGEEEEKSQERWCMRSRLAGTYKLNVRYWEKEPVAAKFDTALPAPITCEKLGTSRVIRTWTVPNQPIKRHHCEITGGALAGLQAMVSEADNAPVHIFSPKYVEMDAALKNKLASEGM